ncbi:MAG: molybdopterin cofactor-binding domain-containing protein [Hyphomicrobiales bacterium]
MTLQSSRRSFLKGASAAGVALVIGFKTNGVLAAAKAETASFNPFVKILPDGTVSVVIKHFEMGQGTTTGLATLVAEELDADWNKVTFEFAPADVKRYANLFFKVQGTGGSTAIANSFMQYRQAGAAARAMLVEAAAKKWGIDATAITVENGVLKAAGKMAGFGEMAVEAAKLKAPAEPSVKDPKDFKLIGRVTLPRKDSPAKTDGTAMFAMDVKVPGMVHVVILRAPKFGGMLKSFEAAEAKKIKGFVNSKALPNKAGVAVYAKSTWAAIQAREALAAEWDFSKAETRSSDEMAAEYLGLLDKPQYQARKGADAAAVAKVVSEAAKTVEAEFVFPFLAHAPMEPLNCVIEPTENGVRVHDGCQFPTLTQPTVAAILQLKPEQVEINTVLAGGSFGRRATPVSDYHAEAAMAYALLGGKTPVKAIWTREDDLAGGFYRPMAAHRVKVGFDEAGTILGWDHQIVAKPILKGTAFESFAVKDGVDHASVEGTEDTDYALPQMSVGLSDAQSPVPVLWWRSVGHTHTAYVMETVLDMAAEAAGKDPFALRLELLAGDDVHRKRLTGVLKLAAEKAGWGTSVPKGHGRGIAVHKSFNSYVAQIAEVSVNGDGAVKIEKVTCAVDCGVAVNPDVVRAQMEGGIGYGLGAIMRNEVTLSEGEVEQANFPDYEPLRISDMPHIEVHIVPSAAAPTGVGEPGTPPIGPAVANAIYAATGRRITKLPMTKSGIEFA